MIRTGLAIAGLLGIVLGLGCQGIGTTRLPLRGHAPEICWDRHISASARAELAVRDLRLEFVAHPRDVFRSLEAEALARPDPDRLLTLGEVAYRIATRTGPCADEDSLTWFRDAAVYGSLALADPRCTPGTACEAIALHNRALAQCVRKSRACRARRPSVEMLAAAGIVLEGTDPELNPLLFDRLEVAGDFLVNGLTMHRIEGLGVPLLAVREMPDFSQRQGLDRFYGQRLIPPVTAVLMPSGSAGAGEWRSQPVRLVVFDPMAHPGVSLGGRVQTLAADFTTPLAFQEEQLRASPLEIAGVVDPEKLAQKSGIYQIHPYRPGQIPVLFVHGLASSPGTWVTMFNELRGDPVLRERYQFWFAYYPTGYPAPVSVASLRKQLHALQQTIDPHGADPALQNMVVVGHSLGGIASRLLIQSSGNQVWNSFFTRPPESVAIPPDSTEWVRSIFFFEPEPTIRRAVFIAAPHQGSELANRLLGRLSSALVRPSKRIAELRDAVIAQNGLEVLRPEYRRRMINSIDNLEWESPMLQALAALPLAPGIPYHSIIGNINPIGDSSRWNDGVVRFASAHLDGAVSEAIVPYTHSGCTKGPQSIAEVRRILFLHLGETMGRQPGSQ
jgi:pimeloyl-ACP methyl ester carboxylesterase